MKQDEFLSRLGELLACLPADQVEEAKQFYAEASPSVTSRTPSPRQAWGSLSWAGRFLLAQAPGRSPSR